MKRRSILSVMAVLLLSLLWVSCNQRHTNQTSQKAAASTADNNHYGGYANQIEWGHHLVMASGCSDCHTPKRMTKMGPVPDTTLLLSGHPADMPLPDIDPKVIESKGLAVTTDETVWIGPWGISYSANLTPDKTTGIGNWSEAQFIRSIRQGKYMGAKTGRQLLPPMPWRGMSRYMSDEALKAIFVYLQSIKPVHNVVPRHVEPVAHPAAMKR
jgi:mono/diheme cytochrome c family protein